MTKTIITKPSMITRHWHLIDLKDKVLGRSATQISKLLIGKNKPYYTAHLDCGDYIVAINAAKVKVTGKKKENKLYRHHTGYPGGFKELTYNQMMAKDPKKIIQLAVKGMLPKNKLRSARLKRLKVFINDTHPYSNKFTLQESTK